MDKALGEALDEGLEARQWVQRGCAAVQQCRVQQHSGGLSPPDRRLRSATLACGSPARPERRASRATGSVAACSLLAGCLPARFSVPGNRAGRVSTRLRRPPPPSEVVVRPRKRLTQLDSTWSHAGAGGVGAKHSVTVSPNRGCAPATCDTSVHQNNDGTGHGPAIIFKVHQWWLGRLGVSCAR